MPITLKQELQLVDDKLVLANVCQPIGITTAAGMEFVRYSLANALLFERKMQDYGRENIAEFGTFGCLVRMTDKIRRIKHLFNHVGRRRKAINESISDSFRDTANYAIIAQMVEDKKW